LNSVVDTVKENPVPVLLIGAGIGWMIYNSQRTKRSDDSDFATEDTDYEPETEFAAPESAGEIRYDPDTHYDRPLEYPSVDETGKFRSASENASGKFESAKETLKEKASAATEQVKEKLSDVGEKAREKMSAVRERASEFGAQVKDRTREAYQRSREKVVATADEHPLALGLGCLAIGLIAGLSLPTPEKVNRVAGPTVDRLRDRTRAAGREMLDKSKRVVQTATQAAKDEAKSQGLSFESGSDSGSDSNSATAEANTNSGNESGSIAANPSPA
jgi:hypothetical protein